MTSERGRGRPPSGKWLAGKVPKQLGVTLPDDVALGLQHFMRTEQILSPSQAVSLLIRIALSSVAADATPLHARAEALYECRNRLNARVRSFLQEILNEYEQDARVLRQLNNESGPKNDLLNVPESMTPWYEAP